MRNRYVLPFLFLLLAFPALAQEQAPEHPAFAKLKTLVGAWDLLGEDGKPTAEKALRYRLTAGGSALAETMFQGAPKEMMTLYHLDGREVQLTHYCAVGNQPRMRLTHFDGEVFQFRFMGGTNLDASRDMHMHDLTLHIDGDGTLRQTWVLYEGETEKSRVDMTLRRHVEKKAPATRPTTRPVQSTALEETHDLYGAGVSSTKALPVGQVLANPKDYTGRKLRVTGPVVGVCLKKGCWMRLGTEADNLFVKFKDYAFFVPTDTEAGAVAVLEGQASVTEQSIEEVRHYLEDAGKFEEAEKVTQPRTVVTFMATGVGIEK